MLKAKLVKNGVSGAGHISGVVVMVCVIIGWPSPARSAEPATTPEEQPHLQLAPINFSHRVGGIILYDFLLARYGGPSIMRQSLGTRVNVDVGATSFLWQPWLALVRSNLGASVSNTISKGRSSPTGSSVATSLAGEAALNMVKYSRFPFEARVFRENSRFDSNFSGSTVDVQRTGYSLDQAYRTRSGFMKASANFNSNKEVGSSIIGAIYTDRFHYSFSTRPARFHTIMLSGNATRQKQPSQGRTSASGSLVANHSYQPNMSFSVSSLANTSKRDTSQTLGSSPTQQSGADSLQVGSFMSLRPDKSPLTLTSSVRFLRSDNSYNGIPARSLKVSNFNLGANYLFSSLIRMYGSVNVADSDGTQTVFTDAALTAAKPFAFKSATDIGGFRYSGSIGGSLSANNTNTTSPDGTATSQKSLGLRVYLSHALDKSSEFGEGRLAKKLSQTVTMGVTDTGSSISNLNSGASLTWNRAQGRESTLFRLSARDSRSLRGPSIAFQMINLQASRTETISSNESLQGSLTVQATHIGSNTNSLVTITPSAEMSYRNQRVYRVRNLSFVSSLRITDTNIAPTQIETYENQATRTWDNILAYKVGLLEMQLNARIATIYKNRESSIKFYITRRF